MSCLAAQEAAKADQQEEEQESEQFIYEINVELSDRDAHEFGISEFLKVIRDTVAPEISDSAVIIVEA